MKIYDIASADKFELSSTSGDLDYGHRIDKVLDEITDEFENNSFSFTKSE